MKRASLALTLVLAAAACSRPETSSAPAVTRTDLGGAGAAAGGADKIVVCHAPPGNPANAHSIEIGESALPAHLAHGDTIGPCAGGACVASALPCSATVPCCSGSCDATQTCVDAPAECVANGNACASDAECCTGLCSAGGLGSFCAEPACVEGSGACSADAQCCTGFCGTGGACADPPFQCLADGAACRPDDACCSGYCDGTCKQPACLEVGGDCSFDRACCSGLCDSGVCAHI